MNVALSVALNKRTFSLNNSREAICFARRQKALNVVKGLLTAGKNFERILHYMGEASELMGFFNNELTKNKINDVSIRLFEKKVTDEDIEDIIMALDVVFVFLAKTQEEYKDDLQGMYDTSVYFLLDTLVAQMVAIKLELEDDDV